MSENKDLQLNTSGAENPKNEKPHWVKIGEKTQKLFGQILDNAGHRGFTVGEMAIKYLPVDGQPDRLASGHSDILSVIVGDELRDSNITGRIATVSTVFNESKNSYLFVAFRNMELPKALSVVSKALVRTNEVIQKIKGVTIPLPPQR